MDVSLLKLVRCLSSWNCSEHFFISTHKSKLLNISELLISRCRLPCKGKNFSARAEMEAAKKAVSFTLQR